MRTSLRSLHAAAAATRCQPNILLIQTDQLAPQALSFHGNRVSQTPHIDRLMRQGVVFNNAYCNSPLCTPSRVSMMAGQLPTRIRAWDNAAEFSSDIPTYAHGLRNEGYHTVLAGKMHFVGADQLHGYEERLTTDVYPADFGWAPNWDLEESGVRNKLFFETTLSVAEADWVHSSMQMDFDEDVAFQTNRKLRQMARRDIRRQHCGGEGRSRPFFIHASFTEPHDPYSGPKPFWDQYEGVDIDMPAVPFIPRADRDPHAQRIYDCVDAGDYDITEDRIIKARRAYYAMLSYIDSKIGELLATLEQEGLLDDTLIVFTADHGDMQGERGMWFKETYHEQASRVPLFFSATQNMRERYGLQGMTARAVDANVSLVDLLPTLLDLAVAPGSEWSGVDSWPARLDGQSLLPTLLNEAPAAEAVDTIYCEYTSEMIPGGWFMVKRGSLKFIHSQREPLLFDLEADPHEMTNLAGQPAYKAEELELAALAKSKWPDLNSLKQRILESQRSRRLVHKSLMAGKRTYWDFVPMENAADMYIRNTGEALQDLEYCSRAPYRGKRPGN